MLPSDSYSFVSDAHGCRRWLDHCVTTDAARRAVRGVTVLYDVYWSDHLPLIVECNFQLITPKLTCTNSLLNKVIWGERSSEQISK